MSRFKNQSAIEDVRDQVSLDYAQGRYLNHITANLGLTRPVFGFSDDSWRAITKILALQFKQIRTKFHEVLTVILGPRTTVTASLAASVSVDDTQIQANDVSHLPQLGTLVLDAGTASEETLDYCFIDYSNNIIFLEAAAEYAHTLTFNQNVTTPLVFDVSAGALKVSVHPSAARNITSTPVSFVLGRGTPAEEVVIVSAVEEDTGELTLSAATLSAHTGLVPAPIQNQLAQSYLASSEFLVLDSSTNFPDSGFVKLAQSSNAFTATGGTVNSVSYASETLTDQRHGGHVIVFEGNVTAALAGVEANISTNSDTVATFTEDLPATPVVGDSFTIRVIEKYTRNVFSDNALQITRDIADVELAADTEVELLQENHDASLAQIQVVGAGWDVIQTDVRNVEVFIPNLDDGNTVLSASYLHPALVTPFSTTLADPASIGDETLTLTTTAGLPVTGQLRIDSGGANEEVVGYSRQRIVDTFKATGSSTTTIVITNGGLTPSAHVGATVFIGGIYEDVNTSREVLANTADTITIASGSSGKNLTEEQLSLLEDLKTPVWLYHETTLNVENQTIAIAHLAGETVDYEQTTAAAELQSGDIWNANYTFPGPYLYDISQSAPAGKASTAILTESLAGPTTVAVGTIVGRTALEIENATLFPLGAVSPFTAIVGQGSGNREQITISDVNLKQRTFTEVKSAASVGDTALLVNSLDQGGTADAFPNTNGYRVLVDRGGANAEVIYATGTNGTPAIECDPLTKNHSPGETVELLADVLTVDPLDDVHLGAVPFTQRKDVYPGGPAIILNGAVSVGDTVVYLDTLAGLPVTGRCRIAGEDYRYSTGAGNTITLLDDGGARSEAAKFEPIFLIDNQPTPELVEVQYTDFSVDDTTGFPTAGGNVILNFGHEVVQYTDVSTVAVTAPDNEITLTDTSGFPTEYPYLVEVHPGNGLREERVLVTNNDTGLNKLTLASNLQVSHPIGTKVSFKSGLQQKIAFTEVLDGTTLRSSTPFVLQSNHSASEPVLQTTTSSSPTSGFSFPFRMPSSLLFRIKFLFDLIRAAGVQVTVIGQR